jgi:hypothetical protein
VQFPGLAHAATSEFIDMPQTSLLFRKPVTHRGRHGLRMYAVLTSTDMHPRVTARLVEPLHCGNAPAR